MKFLSHVCSVTFSFLSLHIDDFNLDSGVLLKSLNIRRFEAIFPILSSNHTLFEWFVPVLMAFRKL